MFELMKARVILAAMELVVFAETQLRNPQVVQLMKERKEHQRRILETRRKHDPIYSDYVANTLESLYSQIVRIDDILDHLFFHHELGRQVEWWVLVSE